MVSGIGKGITAASIGRLLKARGLKVGNLGDTDVYEFQYEAELQFPDGYEAKCSDEKERGPCAALGLATDRTFQKNEIWRGEGMLHFSGTQKGGWVGEDGQTY